MRSRKSYVVLPNELTSDNRLGYTTRHVGAILYAYAGRSGLCRKTLHQLSRLAHCSVTTVKKAIAELGECGYITIQKKYRYSKHLQRVIFAATEYEVKRDFTKGYTLIPREALCQEMTPATSCVLVYLYQKQGHNGHAYPSIRHTAKELHMATSTVCLAVAALEKLRQLVKLFCRRCNQAFCCNSYYVGPVRYASEDYIIENAVPTTKPGISPGQGVPIFGKLLSITKITLDYILRRREKGVDQFGKMYSFMEITGSVKPGKTADLLASSGRQRGQSTLLAVLATRTQKFFSKIRRKGGGILGKSGP